MEDGVDARGAVRVELCIRARAVHAERRDDIVPPHGRLEECEAAPNSFAHDRPVGFGRQEGGVNERGGEGIV